MDKLAFLNCSKTRELTLIGSERKLDHLFKTVEPNTTNPFTSCSWSASRCRWLINFNNAMIRFWSFSFFFFFKKNSIFLNFPKGSIELSFFCLQKDLFYFTQKRKLECELEFLIYFLKKKKRKRKRKFNQSFVFDSQVTLRIQIKWNNENL